MQADAERKKRFVELRADNRQLGEIGAELQLDIVTVWEWDKELAQEVEGLKSQRRPRREPDAMKPVVCLRCGEHNFPGEPRCVVCRARLRPLLLSVITILGPIGLLIQTIRLLVPSSGPSFAGLAFAGLAFACAGVAWNLIGFCVLLSLRYGLRNAWIAVQIMQGLGLLCSYALGVWLMLSPRTSESVMVTYCGVVVAGTLVAVAWWFYLHTPRVKAFCSKT